MEGEQKMIEGTLLFWVNNTASLGVGIYAGISSFDDYGYWAILFGVIIGIIFRLFLSRIFVIID